MTLLVGTPIAFQVGGERFSAEFCTGPDFSGDCDIGIAYSIFYAAAWIWFLVSAAIGIEIQRYLHRRRDDLT